MTNTNLTRVTSIMFLLLFITAGCSNAEATQHRSVLDEIFTQLLDPTVDEGRKVALLNSPKLSKNDKSDEDWMPVLINLIETSQTEHLRYNAIIAFWRLNESAVAKDVARYLLSFAENEGNDLELRWLAVQGLGGFKEDGVAQGLAAIAMRGSPLLRAAEFQDISKFMAELRDTNNPVSAYLLDTFSPPMKEIMITPDESMRAGREKEEMLIAELNGLLVATNFYESDVFKQRVISKMISESRRTTERYHLRGEVVRLNRALLEEAYPDAISAPVSEELSLRLRAMKALKQIDENAYMKALNMLEKSEPAFDESVQIPPAPPREPELLTPEEETDFRNRLSVDNENDVFTAIQALARGRDQDTIEALMKLYGKGSQKIKGEIALTLAKLAKRYPDRRESIVGFLNRVQREETDALLVYGIEKLIVDYLGEPDRGRLDKLYTDYLKTMGYEAVPQP